MRLDPQPAEKSRGRGLGDWGTGSSRLPPALSFLLLLPLGECPPPTPNLSLFWLSVFPAVKLWFVNDMLSEVLFSSDICSALMKSKDLSKLGKWRAQC